jgi:hypothetical protein
MISSPLMVDRNSIGDGISDTGGSDVGFDPINKVASESEGTMSLNNVRALSEGNGSNDEMKYSVLLHGWIDSLNLISKINPIQPHSYSFIIIIIPLLT